MFSVRINGEDARGWRRWALIAVSIAFGVPFAIITGFLFFDAWQDLLVLFALGVTYINILRLLFEDFSIETRD